MKGQEKVLEWSSNLSRLLDSLCCELAVSIPDQNSLSLLEILDWESQGEINKEELKQLYYGWLESKNVFDLFSAKQHQSYSKSKLALEESSLQEPFKVASVVKQLESLNSLYNSIYLQKRARSKDQAHYILEIERLFSYLDSKGSISLHYSELFYLTAALTISQGSDHNFSYEAFHHKMTRVLDEFNGVEGVICLRSFKNHFLIKVKNTVTVKELHSILQEIQNYASNSALSSEVKKNQLPDIFAEGIKKLAQNLGGKNVSSRVEFLRRVFEENEHLVLFTEDAALVERRLTEIYGKEVMECLEISYQLLKQYKEAHKEIVTSHLSLLQKVHLLRARSHNKNSPKKTESKKLIQGHYRQNTHGPTLIQRSSNARNRLDFTPKKGGMTFKQTTPVKRNQNLLDSSYRNGTRNKTPTHKSSLKMRTEVALHRQFSSVQKSIEKYKNNTSMYQNIGGSRQFRENTPTKTTLSYTTDVPKSYRGAHKKGLSNNSFYERLFFFRNKRVESYQIVMKRLKVGSK